MDRFQDLFHGIKAAELEEVPGPQWDTSKPSLVMVAYNGETGAVLWAVGHHITIEMEDAGLKHLDDLGLEPEHAGVWVWEGRYVWCSGGYEYPMEGYTEPVGTWRVPTDQEWEALRKGECPWDENDWLLKEPNEDSKTTASGTG